MRMHFFRSGWMLALLLALFILLGIVGGPSRQWEIAVNAALLRFRLAHPSLTPPVIALTQLGSVYATLGIGIFATMWLVAKRRVTQAAFLVAGIAAARLTSDGLKLLFDRPRPKFDLPEVVTSSGSYPSGHSANSMAIYLMVALALAAPRHRPAALTLAVVASILSGLTRPYLGVHWPSDVLGGWALGLAAVWLLVWVGNRSGVLPLEQQHQVVGGHRAPLDEQEAVR